MNIQTVNLHDMFENVASATSAPSGKTVVISNEIDSDVEISVDRTHLYNILNNILENAVKYSGAEVRITASSAVINGAVELRIRDNGNGISQSDLKHIFKRFYRGKESTGDKPGMGLGLTYVKLLLEAHGGDITAESTEGAGTCFIIRLPQ